MSKIAKALLMLALLAMSGCKVDKLSEHECRVIRQRELAFRDAILRSAPVSKAEVSDKYFEKCVSGELYSWEDFECIIAAESDLAMSQCMAQIHEEGLSMPQGP